MCVCVCVLDLTDHLLNVMISVLRFVPCLVQISQMSSYFSKGNMFCLTSRLWWGRQSILFSFIKYNYTIFSLPETRLANAQAGVLCHVCVWTELESLWDSETHCEDSCQTGERSPRFQKECWFLFWKMNRKGPGKKSATVSENSLYIHLFMSYWQLLRELITGDTFLLHIYS